LIATAVGHIAIEAIEAGDWVWATNPETGETELKQVVQTFVKEASEFVHLTTFEKTITTTPTHPFYVPEKGWVSAIDLRAGDILVTVNGEYVILEQVQHEILESPVTVYNFEVEGFHTCHVGEQSLLVHNRCGDKVDFDGLPNSTKLKYGNDGKIYSAITYGSDGKIVAKIDFQGSKHYVNSVRERIIPHVHPYVNNNGYMRQVDAITLEELIMRLGG
jgi:hypothetical protein